MKTRKILPGGSQEQKTCTFWAQRKNAICDGTLPICTPILIYMSAGKCRGPKSLNKIELSWFILDLLHFYWFGPLQLREGAGEGVSGVWGCTHMSYECAHAQTHAHACSNIHVKKLQMAANMFIMINMWGCVCTCMCMYAHPNTPHPTHRGFP